MRAVVVQNLIDQTKVLIAIRSTADQPKGLSRSIEFVANILALHPGITVERFERNGKPSLLAYASKKRHKRFDIILNGHVDVVPGTEKQFEPLEQDGKLYGRGALDMKAAMLVMTRVFCELAPQLDLRLGLQIVSDEEIGGQDGTKYQIEQGVATDFVVCGEFTTAGTICNESRGMCQAKINFTGQAAHSAYLWDGKNAVLLAQEYTEKILKHYPIPRDWQWATTCNISSLNTSNHTINRVPDTAELAIDIRYISGDTNFTSRETALAFLTSLDPDAAINIALYQPAHYADPKHPLTQLLAQSVSAATGKPSSFIQKPGAADARYYSATGAPALILGLQGEGLHSDGEYTLTESFKTYYQILTNFLRQSQNLLRKK